MLGFIREVFRVLRPGGHFAFCDMRTPAVADTLHHDFTALGLKILRCEVITDEVLLALERVSEKREQQIMSQVPGVLHSVFRDFVGMKNTALYNMMVNGEMMYLSYLLQKIV